jgi:hypothetical protein
MPFGGLLTAGIGAGTSLLGGLFGANASSKASQQYIAALQKAQGFLQGQEKQGLDNYSPYLDAGKSATTTLSSLLGTPGQGLLTPWTQQFTAPTAAEAEQTPGYQFQLQQGENAMQNSAAGRGGLLSGRTLADLNNFAQGTASTNYQNTFNNAQTQYQSAYQSFLNNQNNQYSRLMGLSGEGLNAAQGAGGFMTNMGGDIASLMGQQGAAAAAGTMGAANAWTGAMSGVGNAFTGGLQLKQLNGTNPFSIPSWNGGTFNGGSVGGVSNPGMGSPSYMPMSSLSGSMPTAPIIPGLNG